jgi:hypothetical protein
LWRYGRVLTRRFLVRQPATRGGVECLTAADHEEEMPCQGKPLTSPLCKGLNCEGHYGPFGECSKPCMVRGLCTSQIQLTHSLKPPGGNPVPTLEPAP